VLGLDPGNGGGIYNHGAVTLRQHAVRQPRRGQGGGIHNRLGAATFTSSAVSGNSAANLLGLVGGDGGGICNNGGTVRA
jgi:hypothetical protein